MYRYIEKRQAVGVTGFDINKIDYSIHLMIGQVFSQIVKGLKSALKFICVLFL